MVGVEALVARVGWGFMSSCALGSFHEVCFVRDSMLAGQLCRKEHYCQLFRSFGGAICSRPLHVQVPGGSVLVWAFWLGAPFELADNSCKWQT